jgi:SAM-dependent methyltransferase/N-acetylglutamate synthase-like GNAT family acetyltransferase
MKETNEQALKEIVRQKYAQIAEQDPSLNAASCCGAGPASKEVYKIMADDYNQFDGYVAEADLGLGCGLPTQYAQIKKGDVVIDLGSGAGNDCFVARSETGTAGKVIGIDFTEAMVQRARTNAEKLGYHNVEFRQGDIEAMPVNDRVADVIVSNCVLNLVPNKQNVFAEIFRVLKPGGHFSISDIVLLGELPTHLQEAAEMYAGCVSGAIAKEEYLRLIEAAGFENITLQKQKPIYLPDDILQNYLSDQEIDAFRTGSTGIESITVYAEKSAKSDIELEISAASAQDFQEVANLLQTENLPTDDLSPELPYFLLARANGVLVGVAGLEVYGSDALLRSVAVHKDYRNFRIARRLTDDLLKQARLNGIKDIYLITTTADRYFEKQGYSRVYRANVPTAIGATQQFSSLCPSSAVVMHRRIEKPKIRLSEAQNSCCIPNSGCC